MQAPVELAMLSTAVFLGGLVSGFSGFAFSVAAGALGSLTAMPGALMVVWCELRGLSKESQRALVQPFIIAVQIFAIGLYCLQPHAIGFELFRHLALALPAVGLGTFIGMSMF